MDTFNNVVTVVNLALVGWLLVEWDSYDEVRWLWWALFVMNLIFGVTGVLTWR